MESGDAGFSNESSGMHAPNVTIAARVKQCGARRRIGRMNKV
jgi:hypothetical protein